MLGFFQQVKMIYIHLATILNKILFLVPNTSVSSLVLACLLEFPRVN